MLHSSTQKQRYSVSLILTEKLLLGLSKERPILGDNPKTHQKPFAYHMKSIVLFTEKQQKQLIQQHRHLILTWCFIEGRPTRYILNFGGIWWCTCVFGGACMCIWCMYVHMYLVFCIIQFHCGFHEIQQNFTKTKMIS